jgi:hypothetical protein
MGLPEEDYELSEEEKRSIEESLTDLDQGFFYTSVEGAPLTMKCNKCGRVGELLDRPFPHRIDCELKKRYGR